MLCGTATPALAAISYRIATESNFIDQLRNLVKTRQLESGQILSEEDTAALISFLDQNIPLPKTVSDWLSDSGLLETWVG